MDCDVPPPPPVAPDSRLGWLWWFPLFALFLWQAWMTLTLFAAADAVEPRNGVAPGLPAVAARVAAALPHSACRARSACQRPRSEEPLLSGRHPLHLYFGYLALAAV